MSIWVIIFNEKGGEAEEDKRYILCYQDKNEHSLSICKKRTACLTDYLECNREVLSIPMGRHSQTIRHTYVHGANACIHEWRCTFRSGEQASKVEGRVWRERIRQSHFPPLPLPYMHKLKLKTVNNLLKVTQWLGIVETWPKSQKIQPKSLRLF